MVYLNRFLLTLLTTGSLIASLITFTSCASSEDNAELQDLAVPTINAISPGTADTVNAIAPVLMGTAATTSSATVTSPSTSPITTQSLPTDASHAVSTTIQSTTNQAIQNTADKANSAVEDALKQISTEPPTK